MTLNIADTATENALLTGEGSGRIPPEYPDEAMPVTAGTGSLPSGADVDRHADVKGVFEQLDGWIRRHLRKTLWRQWKHPFTRAKMLMRLGLSEERTRRSASSGRGLWWNSGASYLNQALSKKVFDRIGLVSLMDQYNWLKYMT